MVCSRVTLVATIVSALLLCGDLVLQCHAAKRAPRRRRQLLALEGENMCTTAGRMPNTQRVWSAAILRVAQQTNTHMPIGHIQKLLF